MPARAKTATTAAAISTLGFALLSLLARGERSGYDLTHDLKNPVGYASPDRLLVVPGGEWPDIRPALQIIRFVQQRRPTL